MISIQKAINQGMMKNIKKNFLSEKKDTFCMNKNIQSGTFVNDKIEEKWRGRIKRRYTNNSTEEKFMINEILKKYKISQYEKKGFNFKYILELSDLLGQKDKEFSRKRLKLYNNRINIRKKTVLNNTEKNSLEEFKVPKTPQNFNIKLEIKQKPKIFMTNINGNNKNKTFNNFNKKGNFFNINNYNKPSFSNYNSPNRINSLKYLLTEENKNLKKNLTNKKIKNNINPSFYLTQYYSKNEDSFDNTSLDGKEAFLLSGDREKYHEYLQKQYKFFEQPKLRQAKYLFEKQKRIKLFKNLPNLKFLNMRIEDPIKTEIFNRIYREKNHVYFDKQKDLLRIKKKKHLDLLNNKKNNKLQFYRDCKNLLSSIEKNLNQ